MASSEPRPHRFLLAVDLGLRCGLARYDDTGRLVSYRSTNFGSVSRLRSAVWTILRDAGPPEHLILEGDRTLARHWRRAAERQGCQVHEVSPETWRQALLLARQQRSGADAKEAADELARQVIDWSGAPRPTRLRHDAAEAILIGLWAVLEVGWLDELPPALTG